MIDHRSWHGKLGSRMIEFRFEPYLDFQLQAVDAVCDPFRRSDTCRTRFTVTRDRVDRQQSLAFAEIKLGARDQPAHLDDEILTG